SEPLRAGHAGADDLEQASLAPLPRPQPPPKGGPDDRECALRRGEVELGGRGPDPERPADALGEIDRVARSLVQPAGGHRAVDLAQDALLASVELHECEDR